MSEEAVQAALKALESGEDLEEIEKRLVKVLGTSLN